MKSMISGYRHRPGEHCGSTVMRNMLLHYCDLDISEPLTFGLGSGIECIYLSSEQIDPEAVVFGRSATLEQDLSDRVGAPVQVQPGKKGRGKLVISYNSLDELDGILEHIR